MTFDEALTMVRNELNKVLNKTNNYVNKWTSDFYKPQPGNIYPMRDNHVEKEQENLRSVLYQLDQKVQKNEITTCSDLEIFLEQAKNFVVEVTIYAKAGIHILDKTGYTTSLGISKDAKDAIDTCLEYLKQPATSMTP